MVKIITYLNNYTEKLPIHLFPQTTTMNKPHILAEKPNFSGKTPNTDDFAF